MSWDFPLENPKGGLRATTAAWQSFGCSFGGKTWMSQYYLFPDLLYLMHILKLSVRLWDILDVKNILVEDWAF